MQGVGQFIITLLKNKWFWIVLATIVGIMLIRRHWWKIRRTFKPKDIDLKEGETATGKIPEYRRNVITEVAQQIRNDIYDTSVLGHNYAPYQEAEEKFTDKELNYLANYYKKQLSDKNNSLYEDIDSQYYTQFYRTNYPAKLKTRLKKIGQG